MARFVALLRGINVSGQKKIRMAELRECLEGAGLSAVETYLQSGNVVFESGQRRTDPLAEQMSAAIADSFGFGVPVLVRTARDLKRVADTNPFVARQKLDPSQQYVTFLEKMPTARALRELVVPARASEQFLPGKQELFVFCPNGYGRAVLNNGFFEQRLKTVASTRNWKTVCALAQMSAAR
jgi:uncharacterized protein (DUF1697 family)